MQKNLILFLISTMVVALGSACGTLTRSEHSGYYSLSNDYDTDIARDNLERGTITRDETARELGYSSSRSLTDPERRALEERLLLVKAEKTLTSKIEKEQYYQYKPVMKSDRERIKFLEISSIEGRERWLASHGFLDGEKFSPEMQDIIDSEDIAVGMTTGAVRKSWGDPMMVEIAGDPLYGNERWKYSKHVSTPEGYQAETKIIYFEAGRVAGWEKF